MRFIGVVGWVLVLYIRGFALLILIPVALAAWILVHCWAQDASLRQTIAWYDLNFVAILVNGPFRIVIPASGRPRFAALSTMGTSPGHRVTWLDLN